jgi:hypothetical protein
VLIDVSLKVRPGCACPPEALLRAAAQAAAAHGGRSPRRGRGAITPTPRQQGIETAPRPVSSRWAWTRLLKRVFVLDLERCPRGQSGCLRIIAALPCRPVIGRLLSPLQLAPDPPPLAPVRQRLRQCGLRLMLDFVPALPVQPV